MVRDVTFDSRRPTTRPRHSTVDGRQPKVGCRFTAVGCRMSNVVETYQPDQVSVVVQVEIEKGAVTTQENAVTTQENSLTTQENTVTTQESVVTNEKNIANEILVLIKETPEITLGGIAEKIGISRDGVKYHIERLKRSVGLIHEGATKKGRWVVVTG